MEETIAKTIEFVKEQLRGQPGCHDWWHTLRVWQLAKQIAEKEQADIFVVELAALMHDVADWKFSDKGIKPVRDWLISQNIDKNTINHVSDIIESISFKGAKVESRLGTIEGQIVQDADRLDAIGAIGIARAFTYSGFKGRELHNPNIKPVLHNSAEDYKNSKGTTINHFYEKLLLLKQMMNTETAKQLAEERHKFLEHYLKQFYREWEN